MLDMKAAERQRVRVLILAPRSKPSLEVLDLLEQAVRRASPMIETEAVTLNPRGEYGGLISEVALQIPQNLESADAVIADLTDTDPNVMYELGFAHALKKPVLPIVRKGNASIPSDLQGYLYYVYDLDAPHELFQTVERWLRRMIEERRP
jgi:hypothetical protein